MLYQKTLICCKGNIFEEHLSKRLTEMQAKLLKQWCHSDCLTAPSPAVSQISGPGGTRPCNDGARISLGMWELLDFLTYISSSKLSPQWPDFELMCTLLWVGFCLPMNFMRRFLANIPKYFMSFLELSFLDEVQTSLKLKNLVDLPKYNLRGFFTSVKKLENFGFCSKLE